MNKSASVLYLLIAVVLKYTFILVFPCNLCIWNLFTHSLLSIIPSNLSKYSEITSYVSNFTTLITHQEGGVYICCRKRL